MREQYLNRWFELDYDNKIQRAKCVDIEFESDLGPLFLMKTKWGKRFWMTRRELKEADTRYMPNNWFPERD